MRSFALLSLFCVLVGAQVSVPTTREYYIAAVEIGWDYIHQDTVDTAADQRPKDAIQKYIKAVYREYTDATYSVPKPRPAWAGIQGPLIHAQANDKVVIHFKNLASQPFSISPVGVTYWKQSEGAGYDDSTAGEEKEDDAVPPGGYYEYVWEIHPRDGPTSSDPECLTYSYSSQVDAVRDFNSGLLGPLLICKSSAFTDKGIRRSKEFVLLFAVFDETKSWYGEVGERRFRDRYKKTSVRKQYHTINGYINSTLPGLTMCQGRDNVFWHLIGMGTAPEIHSIQFQDHTLQVMVHRKVTVEMTPMTFITAEMRPSALGRFLISCQIHAHRHAGMSALFTVEDCPEELPEVENKVWTTEVNTDDDKYFDLISVMQPGKPRAQGRSAGRKPWMHYIAAEEVTWDYAPHLHPGDRELSPEFFPTSPQRLGFQYKKVVYVEYTDRFFTTKKRSTPSLMGPLLKGEVNDEFKILFKNLASRPYNLYPSGLTSVSPLLMNAPKRDLRTLAVPPNGTFGYRWRLTGDDGPLPSDQQCLTRLYQSTVDPERDLASGLVGPLLICKHESIDRRGNLVGPEQEKRLMFAVFDENRSWYINENIQKYSQDPSKVNPSAPDFYNSNVIYNVNGIIFSGRQFVMCQSDVTFWHVANVGTQSRFLSIYFRGNPFQRDSVYESVLTLFPMTGETVPMETELAGEWEISAFDGSLKSRGMTVRYTVRSCHGDVALAGDEMYGDDLNFSDYLDDLFKVRSHRSNRTVAVRLCKKHALAENSTTGNATDITNNITKATGDDGSECEVRYVTVSSSDEQSEQIPREVLEELERTGGWAASPAPQGGGQERGRQRRQIEAETDREGAVPELEAGVKGEAAERGDVAAETGKAGAGEVEVGGEAEREATEAEDQGSGNGSGAEAEEGNSGSGQEDQIQIRQANGTGESIFNGTKKSMANGTGESRVNGTEETMADRTGESKSNGREQSKVNGTEESKSNGTEQSKANGTEESKFNGTEQSKVNGKERGKSNGTEESKSNGREQSKVNGREESNEILEDCDPADHSTDPFESFDPFDQLALEQNELDRDLEPSNHIQSAAEHLHLSPPDQPNANVSANQTATPPSLALQLDYDDYSDEGSAGNDTMSGSGALGRSVVGRYPSYYITAQEITWDYGIRKSPLLITPLEKRQGMRKFLPEYKKVVYRSYKNKDFQQQVTRGELQEHLGIMGPVIRVEVNDLLTVTFRNMASRPYSLHLHGVYDMTQSGGLAGEPVPPGEVRVYTWRVSRTQGPTDTEFDCKAGAYYSTVNKERDLHSGLMGPLVICRPGTLHRDLNLQPHVQEFSLLFHTFDETQSWYHEENLRRYCLPPCEARPDNPWYQTSNRFAAINGYVAETLPDLLVAQRQRVRWHLLNLGGDGEYHAVHFHSLPISMLRKEEHRLGVYNLYPGVFGTVEALPSTVGTWLLECAVGEHQLAGMRAKLLVYDPRCVQPLGMRSGRIKDSQITASDHKDDWEPRLARLELSGSVNAWMGRTQRSWLQVDLLKPTLVHGLQTQGAKTSLGTKNFFIMDFTLSYSLDLETWTTYRGNSTSLRYTFKGNMDGSKVQANRLSPPILGRYIRVQPLHSKSKSPALRMELLGCDLNSCSGPLGLEKRWLIPDSSFSSSSFLKTWLLSWTPDLARLNQAGRANAWRPKYNNPYEWLQVDLLRVRRVTGVLTQGAFSMLTQMMVTEFSVTSSEDGYAWASVLEKGSQKEKVFEGNSEPDVEALSVFNPPLFARYVRIHPRGWVNDVALRVEFLGCDTQQSV